MKTIEYNVYLTTCHCQESHALKLCSSSNPEEIKNSVANAIKSMNLQNNWWYSPSYAEDKAAEIVAPVIGCETVKKIKRPFFSLGFIVTNYPMWPDNEGGYEKEFYL